MTLKQIDRAAQRFADELMIPTEIPGALAPLIHDIAVDSFQQGLREADYRQWNSVDEDKPIMPTTVLVSWVKELSTNGKRSADVKVAYYTGSEFINYDTKEVFHPEI